MDCGYCCSMPMLSREIWLRTRTALKGNEVDVHTRLMRRYTDIPNWWFLILMVLGIAVSIATVEGYKSQLQLPWWGILLACALASFFTLPVGVIAATTNQVNTLPTCCNHLGQSEPAPTSAPCRMDGVWVWKPFFIVFLSP